jgi:nucleotidyltransferase substrate binding protein (TIGR01987 family)
MTRDQRFETRQAQFRTACERLREALRAEEQPFARDPAVRRVVLGGIVKAFEFCYELGWKAMQKWLQDQGLEARTPRQAFEGAIAAGLIADPEAWSEVKTFRDKTSHTYDEETALEVAAFARARGLGLFEELAQRLAGLK